MLATAWPGEGSGGVRQLRKSGAGRGGADVREEESTWERRIGGERGGNVVAEEEMGYRKGKENGRPASRRRVSL